MQQLYVVVVEMSSPFRVAETEHPDEDTVILKYKFPLEVRKQIISVRNRYRRQLDANTVTFYGLRLANEELLRKVREIVREADAELKKIDPSLSARLYALPVSRRDIEKGELYQKIVYAIQYRIAKEVFDRVKDLKSGFLKPETRRSIREMLNELRKLNIVQDPDIDGLIRAIEDMLTLTTNEIREKLKEQLEYIVELLES